MSMDVSFRYPMGIGMGIGVIFKNKNKYGYSSTHFESVPLSFLWVIDIREPVTQLEESAAVSISASGLLSSPPYLRALCSSPVLSHSLIDLKFINSRKFQKFKFEKK